MPTKTTNKSVDWKLQYRTGPADNQWFDVYSPTQFSFQDSVTVGGSVRDWKGKIRRLESATTPLTGSRRVFKGADDVRAVLRYRLTGDPIGFERYTEFKGCAGANIGVAGGGTISLTSADNQALQSLNRKVDDAVTAMQGLVSAGELGETLRMLRSAGRSLFTGQYRLLSDLRKAGRRRDRPKTEAAIQKYASERWLEYVFGWGPLISDAKAAAEGISRLSRQTPEHRVINANGRDDRTIQSFKNSSSRGNLIINRTAIDTTSAQVRYTACVKANPPTWAGNLQTFGIAWDQVVITAWELIPYSFLVDYFTNVGDIINACTRNRSNVAWVVKNTLTSRKRVYRVDSFIPVASSSLSVVSLTSSLGSEASRSDDAVNRSDHSGQSWTPSLEFEIPGLGRKWLNLAALGASWEGTRRLWSR